MRFGVSIASSHIEYLSKSQWDYGQLNLISLYNMSEEDFNEFLNKNKESKIKFEVGHNFFLKRIGLLGPRLNIQEIGQYSNRVLNRASQLGLDTLVLSNGPNRTFDISYGFDRALIDFKKTLEVLGELGQRYDIKIALEGISCNDCNMVNLLTDAYKVVKDLDHENIVLSASFYHMRDNKESFDAFYDVAGKLSHVNISSYSSIRRFPSSLNEDRYGEFFDDLKKIDYKGRISVEASSDDLEGDSKVTIDLLKSLI